MSNAFTGPTGAQMGQLIPPGEGQHGTDFHMISRFQIETLEACADRITESDTFNASWVSGCVGAGVAFAVGCITTLANATRTHPNSVAIAILGIAALACGLLAYIVYKIEERSRKNRKSHVQALNDNLDLYRKYMIPDEASRTKTPDSPPQPKGARGATGPTGVRGVAGAENVTT